MGSVHLDHLTPVSLSFAPLTVRSLLAALVGNMFLLKPYPKRLVADLDLVNRQKLLAGMGGTEFLVPITAERDGFVLYLIRYPIM
jgi:hypothetical protein